MTEKELQRKFLRRAMDAEEVLETAIAWERGLADQMSIEQHSKSKTANTSILPEVLETTVEFRTVETEPVRALQRPDKQQQQRRGAPIQNCINCGNQFGPNHLQRCPARGQNCRTCAKPNHFSRMCRSANQQQETPSAQNKQEERPKRMRFIEQDDDVDDLLEADTQVRAIATHEREEGEIIESGQSNRDVLDIHMQANWDDYGNLAVNNKKGTPRYMIELKMNETAFKFTVDTGSPASITQRLRS